LERTFESLVVVVVVVVIDLFLCMPVCEITHTTSSFFFSFKHLFCNQISTTHTHPSSPHKQNTQPLSLLLVTWFLCYSMGTSTLVGIVVLIAFLPINNMVTKQMTILRSQRVELSDERVEITCSMLMGIRSTKLNGYEQKYKERVEEVRHRELKLLAKEQACWATTLVMTLFFIYF
jgi:hypothetical protein